MSLVFPALGAAFAALCVWLTVRIVNRRERWAKRGAIALGAFVVYTLSFGPVCWINSRAEVGTEVIWAAYRPLFGIIQGHGPRVVQEGLLWYLKLGVPDDHFLATWDGGFFWQVGPIFD